MLRPEWHMAARTEDVVHDLYARDLAFTDNVEAFCYMDVLNYLGNHHVHRVDQFTMAVSVEGRFPFLDHEVVELAFRIPSRLKVGNGQQKLVLRQVAAGLISPDCLRMKKKGFGLPLAAYLQGPLAGVARESVARLRERGVLSDGALDALHRGTLPAERHWQLVMLDLWMERFVDRAWHAVFD
jgi:asparagine synthase (glutamine-hydrolysing)